MSKFYQDKKFVQLQKKWYAKLQKEGFADIETIGPDGEPMHFLTSGHGCYASNLDAFRKWSPDKQRYYELARNHYWNMPDEDPERKDAFGLYAFGGLSLTRVARLIGWGKKRVAAMVKAEEAFFMPRRPPKLELVK